MYQPEEFDKIRETYFSKPSRLERAVAYFCIGFTIAVCGITLLFASKASALETLGTGDYTRAKT